MIHYESQWICSTNELLRSFAKCILSVIGESLEFMIVSVTLFTIGRSEIGQELQKTFLEIHAAHRQLSSFSEKSLSHRKVGSDA